MSHDDGLPKPPGTKIGRAWRGWNSRRHDRALQRERDFWAPMHQRWADQAAHLAQQHIPGESESSIGRDRPFFGWQSTRDEQGQIEQDSEHEASR